MKNVFVDSENSDYRVRPGSLALKVGFKDFEVNTRGLQKDFPDIWD